MSSPWAAVSDLDIAKRWRPLTPAEEVIAPAIIVDSQDILEGAAEDLGITPPGVSEERRLRIYVRVISAMVIRVLQNPDGILSETIDDYTYRRDSAVSSGALYVSDAELDQLRAPGKRRRGAFTVVPS